MLFQKLLGYLDDADARGNRLTREMDLIDEVIGIQMDVIKQRRLCDVLRYNLI
jgi:hypothetical protein